MDAFDDLLSTSRRQSEDNPFDDPFSKPRSSSPDPWANPFAHAQSASAFDGLSTVVSEPPDHEPAVTNAFSEIYSFGAHEDREDVVPNEITGVEGHSTSNANGDEPLQVAVDKEPLASGFREVTSTPLEVEATFSVLEPAPVIASRPSTSSIAAVVSPPSLAGTSPLSSPSREQTPPASSTAPPLEVPASSSVAAPTPPTRPAFVSPLTQTDSTVVPSFPNLSLGGEAWNGWPTGQNHGFSNGISGTGWKSNQAVEDDEDDDDDRPLQAIVDKSRAAEANRQSEAAATASVDGPTTETTGSGSQFTISVDDPQKVGDPIRGYTMYTVHTKTTAPGFRSNAFSVLRRYSDFLWLYETLSLNNPGVVVPPVPEKSPFGRFEDAFVQQRRQGLEKCINKIANHPVLAKDADLKIFLESDTFALDIKQRKAEIANERGGLMASLGQSITGPRFHETDEWFDQKKTYLDSLESQLRGFVKAIDTVAKQRAELAAVTGEFAAKIQDLSESDVGPSLVQSLSGLALVQRKSEEIQSNQSRRDVETILSTADEYARLINSVRLAFTSRIRTYNAWQSAEGEVRRVKQAHERNRAQGRIPPERIGLAMNQVADVERRALEAKTEFEQCSRLIKQEVARFETERIGDFKQSLQAFLDGMIDGQKQLISSLEAYQQMLLKKTDPDQSAPTAS